MLITFFTIVKIITFIGMVATPFNLLVMRKEVSFAMERAKNEEEAIAICKKHYTNFKIKFLLFIISALILNIISTFY